MSKTPSEWLNTVVTLVAELPKKMPEAERYSKLLQAVRTLFPCDAVALLRLEP
jgi:anaerobic nitric oxide reductase transcription regulator